MVKLQYMTVGKEVLAATLGGSAAGALHFMFLQPQFPGQMYGINISTIVDFIIAFIIGAATTLYAKTALTKLLGWGLAGTLGAIGLLQQFNVWGTPAPVVRVARVATPVRANITAPVRAPAVGSYQITA